MASNWRDQIRVRVTPSIVDLEPKTTALLVVDMQNMTCNAEKGIIRTLGKTYPQEGEYILNRATKTVIPNIQKLLKFFRGNNLRVFYCQMGPRMADGSDLYTLRKLGDAETQKRTGTHFIFGPGTFEYETIDELKPAPGELVVNKRTRSVFNGTGFNHTLRMVGIDSLVITGACTDICVLATALDAIDLGFKGILIDDATATFSQAAQDFTMLTFESYFSKVKNTDEIISDLAKKIQK